jgi:trans-aconitate methyltransferase
MLWNADSYTQKHAFVFGYGESVVELLDPRPGELVLDLGCGSGELTQRIAQLGATVVGLDASPEMVALARQQFPELAFRVADASTFDFPEQFDAVFSNATLHWIPAATAVAQRIYQHLRPGGRFVAELGGRGNVAQIIAATLHQLRRHGHPHPQGADWWYFPSVGEYASLLETQGFRVRLALHFDRPTPLADPETGLVDWLNQFGELFFVGLTPTERTAVLAATTEQLRPTLWHDGRWVADYKRLRIVAEKPVS